LYHKVFGQRTFSHQTSNNQTIESMTGIITIPLVPLRESDNERSEMTSQLLFGECVEILETRERWLLVCNLSDNYSGWVDRKMIQILSKKEELPMLEKMHNCVSYPLIECCKVDSDEKIILPGGSNLFNLEGAELKIDGKSYLINPLDLPYTEEISGDYLISLAKRYLNAPYLWGGKTILGIDCSGLVQVVFSICGIQLARDASQQVESGIVIDFLSEAKAGDLAFFENAEGKIIHVGILLNSQKIIHASGWVKIDTLDSQGIISAQTGEYTHKLRVVKRII